MIARSTDLRTITTADELLAMHEPGVLFELVQGEVRTMSPAGAGHGEITMRLGAYLTLFVDERQLGKVFSADTGFIVGRDPDSVRSPDCAFVAQARLATTPVTEKYWPGAPDLAVEVVSPHDAYTEVDEKVAMWLACGSQCVVTVDPRRRQVVVHRPDGATQRLGLQDDLTLNDLLPGWSLDLHLLFLGSKR